MITYRTPKPGKLDCSIDLTKLLPTGSERKNFDDKWSSFIESDDANKDIFERKGNHLFYKSEQLIPSKRDHRPALLLVFGNPASHSVKSGMFFAFKGNRKENRFWKSILSRSGSGILDLPVDPALSTEELNTQRRKLLLNLDYDSQFRIGLCVFISMPSAPGGKWGGVAGIQRLIGSRAMRRLEEAETGRVIQSARSFVTGNGAVISFQKNVWNSLSSKGDAPYDIKLAKEGRLIGGLKNRRNILLFGVPPTRLVGPCQETLSKMVKMI
jgi:hypothetical protein